MGCSLVPLSPVFCQLSSAPPPRYTKYPNLSIFPMHIFSLWARMRILVANWCCCCKCYRISFSLFLFQKHIVPYFPFLVRIQLSGQHLMCLYIFTFVLVARTLVLNMLLIAYKYLVLETDYTSLYCNIIGATKPGIILNQASIYLKCLTFMYFELLSFLNYWLVSVSAEMQSPQPFLINH